MPNTTTIAGNLTHDPEVHYGAEGVPVARFGVAVSHRRRDAEGTWSEETSFVEVCCFRELAENAVLTLHKGARVVACGRLSTSSWTAQDGTKRSRLELVAEEVGASLRWATAELTRTRPRSYVSGSKESEREFTQ